jgi:class 3 adenylate cyclase
MPAQQRIAMNTPSQPNEPPASGAEEPGRAGEVRTGTGTPPGSEETGTVPTLSALPAPPLPSEPAGQPAEPQELPPVFGRYRILKRLGGGGMGTVYLAHDSQLDRPVALKVPHAGPGQDPQVLERFRREARAAALLHHPNICPVFDVGDEGGIAYLTMAFIEGQTLLEWAGPGPTLPSRQAAAVVRKVALALAEAHARGILHRDLKPSNIMIDARGEPVIMDFGLARRLDVGEERLTLQGVLIGTPAYMAPEQLAENPEAAGAAADVYSLGVILYELLAGRLPFQAPLVSLLNLIVNQSPPPPSQFRPDLDPNLEAICLRAMAREAAGRFASMAEFAAALGDFLSGKPAAPSAGVPPPARPAVAGQVAEGVLDLLRTWGWAMGLRKLKTQIQRVRSVEKRSSLQVCADWLAGDRSVAGAAVERLRKLEQWPSLEGWGLAAQGAVALRERDYARAHRLLERAAAQADAADRVLAATIAHLHGVAYFHEGKPDRALPQLHEALALLGKDHFAVGRVLDTLGMVYAGKGNFHVAREFYEEALRCKDHCEDESGLALSHGQLGRLYLDWGHLDLAEEHFQEDLRLAQKILDERGEAQMYNHLGRVALTRGEREAAAGRRSSARRYLGEAAGWLEESIRRSRKLEQNVAEGFARKDRALVHLMEGNVAAAGEEARRAEELFAAARFAEGTAQVNRVWGMILRSQERHEESLRTLRSALAHFEETQDAAEAARIQWEIARTLRSSGAPSPLVTRAFLDAVERAEGCRRDLLLERIEEELREVDPEAYFRHVYRRVRGRDVDDDSTSLIAGAGEVMTVLCLDLRGFMDYARGQEAEEVLMTLNQVMTDLAQVLEWHRARVIAYAGGGFTALLREARHAERGVSAALDLLAALREFDRPREILGLPRFQARIGLATGGAFLGNVGTYHKIDFTVLGPAATLAARLLDWAEPGLPCVSHATFELVSDRFTCAPGNPRTVTPPGLGPCEVWDVTGRKS